MAGTVVVTGASRGIGAAAVRRFVNEGFNVVAVSSSAERLHARFGQERQIDCFRADVTQSADVSGLCDHIRGKSGVVDVVVNAAGVGFFGSVVDTPEDIWNRVISVNLTGCFLITKALVPMLKQSSKPHLFNVVSTAGRKAFPNCGAYVASKFGLMGLTEVVREELRSSRIRVTAVLPGAVDTPFWDDKGVDFDRSQMLKADDIAEAMWHAYRQPEYSMVEEILIKPSRGDF